jgi:hypothetical protein
LHFKPEEGGHQGGEREGDQGGNRDGGSQRPSRGN